MIMHSRRGVLAAGALTSATFFADAGTAVRADALVLRGDDGKPVPNVRIPSELSAQSLPGLTWTGSASPDVTLIEFFDYNCTWCRKAMTELDALLKRDTSLRLGLANYAVFGVGSIQAAKVQQAVLKVAGPARAYDYHRAMFSRRGTNDGATAMAVVKSLGLDTKAVEDAANGADITGVLTKQAKLAEAIGFNATPSFALNGYGVLGYPGVRSVTAMVGAVRKCEKPVCG